MRLNHVRLALVRKWRGVSWFSSHLLRNDSILVRPSFSNGFLKPSSRDDDSTSFSSHFTPTNHTHLFLSEEIIGRTTMRFNNYSFLLALFSVLGVVESWQQCLQEGNNNEEIGSCPDHSTCCPSSTAPEGFSCIPAKSKDPLSAKRDCCDDGKTGCGYGYSCAVKSDTDELSSSNYYCKLNQDDPPPDGTNDTARYELCSVPLELQTLHHFPVYGTDKSVAYYSNMGDIQVAAQEHLQVSRVLITIHGSARNVDEYFCAALSLLTDNGNENENALMESTLVIAPLFASPEDVPTLVDAEKVLIWADHDDRYPLSHSWRYGADALNAPVSSYAILDEMVDFLLASQALMYPQLKRIALAGHSAGGQVTHRWALLSNSPAWEQDSVDLVSVVANPRSFCYLDDRRMGEDGTYGVPDRDDIAMCPGYNQWQWGLASGGYVQCPYRDVALQQINATAMGQRYAGRKVVYLSGELDTIPTTDQCETSVFQGYNRQSRAKNYVESLERHFGRKVHQWHIIPGSPHDHSLMYQSDQGKAAIFGELARGEMNTEKLQFTSTVAKR